MVLWLIGAEGRRHRLVDLSFVPCFYVDGPEPRLTSLARDLAARAAVKCAWAAKTNIWDGRELRVLEVAVHHPTQFAALVRFVHRYDSGLRLYNSDLMLAPMYCWQKGIFPLARVEVEEQGARDWGLGAQSNRPEAGPGDFEAAESRAGTPWPGPYGKSAPSRVVMTNGRSTMRCLRCASCACAWKVFPMWTRSTAGVARWKWKSTASGRYWMMPRSRWRWVFERLLRVHDPDMILSEWGDATLFPALLRQARKLGLTLSLNRDAHPAERRRARSYMSYGRILFKGSTTTLFGRLHVDTQNSFIADQCDLEGLWELTRVTKLPVQYCARTSTGTGISYMQMELAYGDGVLIPEQKAEPETPKHPDELLKADRGGLVFLPRLGFFTNVGELDFVSEFPSIMARFNISPETVNCGCCPEAPRIPELGYRVCQRRRGITSRVVERLIQKRQEYKRQMAGDTKGEIADPQERGLRHRPPSCHSERSEESRPDCFRDSARSFVVPRMRDSSG